MIGRWPWERLHALLGVGPGLAFLVLHAASLGEATRPRLADTSTWHRVAPFVEAALVVIPLAAHAALGVALHRRPPAGAPRGAEEAGFRSAEERRWHRAAGLAAAAFVAVHVGHAWVGRLRGATAAELVDALAVDLGRPALATLYAVGTTAVAVHVAVGLPVALRRLGVASSDAARQGPLRWGAALLAAVLWLATLDATARLATGGGLVGPWLPPEG